MFDVKEMDLFIKKVCEDLSIPGAFTAVIKDNEILYQNCYGKRDVDKELEVDENTQFRIASNTKAFTATAVGILVDEGLIQWDKPIKNYIKDIEFFDEFLTQRVTVRDLLCHRTGIPTFDFSMFSKDLTRKDCVDLLKYLQPNYDLRVKLQYNNKMFMLAGYLVEHLSGIPFEEFIQRRIFEPLKMNNSLFNLYNSRQTENFSEHYDIINGKLEKFDVVFRTEQSKNRINPFSPAGGIISTGKDLTNWVKMNLSKGIFDGTQIISEQSLKELHSPQMNDDWLDMYPEILHPRAGLGWFMFIYRGQKVISHVGYFGTHIYLIPSINAGIIFLQNNRTCAKEIIPYHIIDRLFDFKPIDWQPKLVAQELKEREDEEKVQKENLELINNPNKEPHRELFRYIGRFEHPAFLKADIFVENNQLFMRDNGNKCQLKHIDEDSFFCVDGDEIFLKIHFVANECGDVIGFNGEFEPCAKPIYHPQVEK